MSQQTFMFRNTDGVLQTLADGNQTADQGDIGPSDTIYAVLRLQGAPGSEDDPCAWMAERP